MCQKLAVKLYPIKSGRGRITFTLPHESNVDKKPMNYGVNKM